MSATGYTIQWLSDRRAIDSQSRNKEVESIFLQHIHLNRQIVLMDLGAGVGNNVMHLSRQIKGSQKWFLLEIDANLVNESQKQIDHFFISEGYKREEPGHYTSEDQSIEIVHVRQSLFELTPTTIQQLDAVVSNALLDVLTSQQLNQLFLLMENCRGPKYFTTNYLDTIFMPKSLINEQYVTLFHAHMRREQQSGHALGPAITDYINNLLKKKQIKSTLGENIWRLDNQQAVVCKHLLNFFESSIPGLLSTNGEHNAFSDWISKQRNDMQQRNATMKVLHTDILWI